MAGRLSAGGFVALMLAMMAIIPALKQLTNVQNMLQRGVASAERLFGVLDADDEVDDGTRPLARAQGLIEFRNVSARYPGQAQPALDDISFDRAAGHGHRDRRPLRQRQVDAGQADPALLRTRGRRDPARRPSAAANTGSPTCAARSRWSGSR